jgi:transcriptional adapter 3
MPPPISQKGAQKGTGKKGRDTIRQSRSRNSTPSLVVTQESGHTAYLSLPIQSFRTCDDIVEHYGGSAIPSSKDLEALLERLQKLAEVVENRGLICDKGMRKLAQERKDSLEEIEMQKRDLEQRERVKKDAADEEERGRNKANKIKKRKDLSTAREERPLTHGAHGLAPQDGTGLGEKTLTVVPAHHNTIKSDIAFNSIRKLTSSIL